MNFVMADNRLIGTQTARIGEIRASTNGHAAASLPSGARQFFKLTSMGAIPVARAASAMVSVEPSYADS